MRVSGGCLRVFRGLSMMVVCCLVGSYAQRFTSMEETTTPKPAAFLNLLADLGFDLYKSSFSIGLKTGRCGENSLSKGDLKKGILRQILPLR